MGARSRALRARAAERMYDPPSKLIPPKRFLRTAEGAFVWPDLPSAQAALAAGQRVSVLNLGANEPVVRLISNWSPENIILNVVVQAWTLDAEDRAELSTLEVISFNAFAPGAPPFARVHAEAGSFCRALPPLKDETNEVTSRYELTEIHKWLASTQTARLLHALELHFEPARFAKYSYAAHSA